MGRTPGSRRRSSMARCEGFRVPGQVLMSKERRMRTGVRRAAAGAATRSESNSGSVRKAV